MRATKAVIRLDYLKENITNIKKLAPENTLLCVPVKANAYGHGIIECAKTAVEAGASYLAIATVDEGIRLRQNGINVPLLILSLPCDEELNDVCLNNITPLLFTVDQVKKFQKVCQENNCTNYQIHIAVDTGMGRIGCTVDNVKEVAQEILSSPNLKLGGIMSHLCVSDSVTPEDKGFTQIQIKRFKKAVEKIEDAGVDMDNFICHLANSAACLDLPETYTLGKKTMLRPGIIVYGYYPDQINKEYLEKKNIQCNLKPVMQLESMITSIRLFKKGDSVGYGRTWIADKDTYIGIIPAGYGDGVFRRFGKAGLKVSIGGKVYPVRGRICMDQCMVDLGIECTVKEGDKVIIFGAKENGAHQTADDLANETDTISYEITTAISDRVPRKYVK